MKYNLFVLFLLFLIPLNEVYSGIFIENSKDANGFIPNGWKLLAKLDADLNNDKINDLILIVDKINPSTNDKRTTMIAFQKNGTYTKYFEGNKLCYGPDEGGMMGDPFSGLSTDRGSFLISVYGGSAWRWSAIYRFRFQKNNFYLIGLTSNFFHVVSGGEEKDYNLLTGKIKITRYNQEDNNKKEEKWVKWNKRTISIDNFDIYTTQDELFNGLE